LAQYSASSGINAVQTSGSIAATPSQEQIIAQGDQGQKPLIPVGDPNVTPRGSEGIPSHSLLSREERVEYRDQDGNLLDEEAVKSLQGKVEFKTRYETRTRLVDAMGNEIIDGVNVEMPVAPPHPDVEGMNPETAEKEQKVEPADAPATGDSESGEKRGNDGQPRPASESLGATEK
jgi:dolichyl-phosphate-mannose-protein mannosyltransferase